MRSPSNSRQLAVLCHMAVPSGTAGITRHDDLYGSLAGWDSTIVAGRISHLTRAAVPDEVPGFETVWTFPYTENDYRRLLNWASFLFTGTARALRLGPLDVVVGSSPHMLNPVAALVVAKLRRARFVMEIRDPWPEVLVEAGTIAEGGRTHRVLQRLAGFLYRQADAVVVLASGVYDRLIELGVDADKVTLVPNGASLAEMPTPEERERQRKELGLTGTCGVYAGAHGPSNGLDFVVDAAARAATDDVTIVLIGDGIDKPRLMERVRAEGVTNLRFLDPMPKAELTTALGAFDFGIHCLADREMFHRGMISPNKLYEYMAHGLPVITNVGGWVADVVTNEALGVAALPDGLGDAAVQMAKTPGAERAAMSENGRRFLAANYSLDHLRGELDGVLKSVSDA